MRLRSTLPSLSAGHRDHNRHGAKTAGVWGSGGSSGDGNSGRRSGDAAFFCTIMVIMLLVYAVILPPMIFSPGDAFSNSPYRPPAPHEHESASMHTGDSVGGNTSAAGVKGLHPDILTRNEAPAGPARLPLPVALKHKSTPASAPTLAWPKNVSGERVYRRSFDGAIFFKRSGVWYVSLQYHRPLAYHRRPPHRLFLSTPVSSLRPSYRATQGGTLPHSTIVQP